MGARIDITGVRFGRLLVIGDAPPTWGRQVLVRCDCGAEKSVGVCTLRSGQTVSCGCFARERLGALRRKHSHASGHQRSPEYSVWTCMRKRCRGPHPSFSLYGGRGITVCARWESFENFLADMGPRPSPKHSIDRIDSDGNYEPDNCRWATRAEQSRNTRRNVFLTFGGQTMCLEDWASRIGMRPHVLGSRIQRGWSIERALTTPAGAPETRLRPNNRRGPRCKKA